MVPTFTAKLVANSTGDLETVIRLSCQRSSGVLLEPPGIIQATSGPILESLQGMYRTCRMEFHRWIVPDRSQLITEALRLVDNPPPTYALTPNFSFFLKPVLNDSASGFLVFQKNTALDDDLIGKVEAYTTLDRGKCEALVAPLSHEFIQIQGPPGTGKSHLGVKITRGCLDLFCREGRDGTNCRGVSLSFCNDGINELSLLVLIKNHVLDQLIEHLLEVGMDKMIRIGRQSNSTNWEDKSLRVVAET